MKKFIIEGLKGFNDKCVIRMYEVILLIIGVMAASIGCTYLFLFYGNDISIKLGQSQPYSFALLFTDDFWVGRVLIMTVCGIIVYSGILAIVMGRSRTVK